MCCFLVFDLFAVIKNYRSADARQQSDISTGSLQGRQWLVAG